jgi:hypothetical protein
VCREGLGNCTKSGLASEESMAEEEQETQEEAEMQHKLSGLQEGGQAEGNQQGQKQEKTG